ncbi:hypothetical protein H310_15348 [Aphanomyces invadans]|uniref:Uncharacterized protein n=1 Tax=Aphanomyces invadans TaxID=157072 RepID=A0A024T7G5_9STRA|nr:hypothetical protein H310_15348 [Aphanomyces invadans]ETV89815.1 hypothetical protein H310_15348 [Aphanomyces invadans]|eukprot:XP_008881553.1 hypothetical protein H310_15348 [Aphanomyces invadans]
MAGLNHGPARTQLFRVYPASFEEAVRIALAESVTFGVSAALFDARSLYLHKTRDPTRLIAVRASEHPLTVGVPQMIYWATWSICDQAAGNDKAQ